APECRSRELSPCMKLCTVDDCSEPPRARGLCQAHYDRAKNHGELASAPRATLVNKGMECQVLFCREPAKSKLFCQIHFFRLKTYGDPFYVKPYIPTPHGTRNGYQ